MAEAIKVWAVKRTRPGSRMNILKKSDNRQRSEGKVCLWLRNKSNGVEQRGRTSNAGVVKRELGEESRRLVQIVFVLEVVTARGVSEA